MKILFFVLSIFLLSACSYLQQETASNNDKNSLMNEPQLKGCKAFPFDESDAPCNLLGWQSFAYQSLTQTPKEHKMALALVKGSPGEKYKTQILLSNDNESLKTRTQATASMFNLSKTHLNNFGHFFYLLAIYNEQDINNEKNIISLKSKVKKLNTKNSQLKTELDNTQSKIQAIMDIEKNINTN